MIDWRGGFGAAFVILWLTMSLLSACKFTASFEIGPAEEQVTEASDTSTWADRIRPLDPRCKTEPCGI